MPYLFAHFREKLTPDGEQVHFSVSRDGYKWEKLNDGRPVVMAEKGEKGARDIEILRVKDGSFVILTTDLLIVGRMDENHNVDWGDINTHGSKCLRMWKTDDLIHFSEERLIYFGRDDFGCLWAPETFYDEENDEYLIHWSSAAPSENGGRMSIYCCTTKDFESFSYPELYFGKGNDVIDSHITKTGDTYHLFYKNQIEPLGNLHASSKSLYGPFEHDEAFEKYILSLYRPGSHEALTTYTLADGKWCMMQDFFGCEKEKMGYVPFVSEKPGDMNFTRCPERFSFPYGFKHGGVVEITDEEYDRVKEFYG